MQVDLANAPSIKAICTTAPTRDAGEALWPGKQFRAEALSRALAKIGTMETTIEKPASKHEMKTKETRELLLRAAETVFVRHGYEGAELGEIAALAGRTKGAIYANFKSKEEMFLAL